MKKGAILCLAGALVTQLLTFYIMVPAAKALAQVFSKPHGIAVSPDFYGSYLQFVFIVGAGISLALAVISLILFRRSKHVGDSLS
jgi:hypothetical protein